MFRTKNTLSKIHDLACMPLLAAPGMLSWLLCALTPQANVAAGIGASVTCIV